MTTEWILGQYSGRRKQAERKYREFVEAGIGGKRIWKDVKGQSILGKEEFVESLINYVKGYEEKKEIPKSQRYISRPKLETLFKKELSKDKQRQKKKVKEAIEKYAYSQREVADYLEVHYCTISRMVNE